MFTRADKILIIALIVISAASYPAVKYLASRGSYLEIAVGGETREIVSMDRDRDVTVEGRLGPATIRIDESGARFVQSPCADRVCVETKPIREAGEIAVCVPNRVMIRVLGERRVQTDFISR